MRMIKCVDLVSRFSKRRFQMAAVGISLCIKVWTNFAEKYGGIDVDLGSGAITGTTTWYGMKTDPDKVARARGLREGLLRLQGTEQENDPNAVMRELEKACVDPSPSLGFRGYGRFEEALVAVADELSQKYAIPLTEKIKAVQKQINDQSHRMQGI